MTMQAIFSTGGVNLVDIPPTIEVFDPPDDRYMPGYRITDNVTGDVKEYGPRLKDLNVPFSLYGLPIPITFGVRRLYGNIIWARPLREVVKKDTDGGKGGPTTKSTTYEYYANFAVALGIPGNTDVEAGDRQVIKLWANGALIYDRRGTGLLKWPRLSFNFYTGSADQLPDPHIESYEGVGEVPAYRDIMYIVFKDFPVSEFGNFLPSVSAEIGDVVVNTYVVQNIDTPSYNGSQANTDFVVDWEAEEAYGIRGGQGLNSVIHSYDIESGEYLGAALVNQNGVGYTAQGSGIIDDAYGISANFRSIGYIPWLNLISGKPNELKTAEPFMLVDPGSGVVTHWIGVSQLTGSGFNPGFPSEPAGNLTTEFFDGYIPQWDYSHPFRVYDLLGYETYIMVASISSFGGDLTLLKIDDEDRLDMVSYFTGWGGGVDIACMCEGENRLNETDFYICKNNQIYKTVVGYGADRAANISLVGALSIYRNTSSTIHSLYYYAGDNSLIVIYASGQAEKWDLESEAILWTYSIPEYSRIAAVNSHLNNVQDGYLAWVGSGGTVYELDLVFGTVTTYDEASGQYRPDLAWYCDAARARIASIGATTSGGAPGSTTASVDYAQSTLYYGRATDSRMTLANFLLGMTLYAGYTEDQIDIDESIDDLIDGALIGNITSYKSVIQSICTAYKIEYFESAGQVKFTRQTIGVSADDFSLTAVDFLRQSPNSPPEEPTLMIRREEEISVPQVVQLRYIDKALNYGYGMQVAQRSRFISTNNSEEQLSIDLPIIMSASEAKELAVRALWGAWNSRVSYSLRTTKKWAKIEPGDFGTLQWDDRVFTCRVMQVNYNSDFTINIAAVNAISDEAITVVADTGNGSGEPQIIPVPARTIFLPMDIPLLDPADDLASTGSIFALYWALGARPSANWTGGTAYIGPDQRSLRELGTLTNDVLVMRVTNKPERKDNWETWDEDNTLTVRRVGGDIALLVDQTAQQVLGGANLCAYGTPNRGWELISFREVTDNGNGTYTLSGLLRGRHGTQFRMDRHRTGERLVLLSSDVEIANVLNTSIGDRFAYKGVTFGQGVSTVRAQAGRYWGWAAQCLPVDGVQINRDLGGDGTLTIRWNRRSRYLGEMVDGGENSILTAGELNEFRVTIWRWAHYDTWQFSGGSWVGSDTGVDPDYVQYEVTGSTLILSLADIRAAELYEFNGPDNPASSGSTFSQQGGAYILENETTNQQIADLGFGEFVAFAYLDVMIEQKNASAGVPQWGPAERKRIYIRDL